MMKLSFTLPFLLIASLLQAQSLPNNNFKNLSTLPCPFDPSVEVTQPVGWRLYQTLDGKWDGPIDSTVCVSVEQVYSWGAIKIDLDQIDASRPLFIRCLLDDDNKILLEPNWLFLAQGYLSTGQVQLNQSNQCEDGICTGVIAGIEIPDETGDSTQLRIYVGPYEDIYYSAYSTCMPTEKFSENYLREFIFKIQADTSANQPQDFSITATYMDVQMMYDIGHIFDVTVPEFLWTGQEYLADIHFFSAGGWGGNYLFMYGADTYPSLTNPYFIDATPEENSPEPKVINLQVLEYESAYFQPFTYLRGGLVEGSDSVRHEANLVNLGGNLCLNFVELIFEENTSYVHHGGQIDITGLSGCMQFRNGGALEVADGATLHYGQQGHGMFALRTGGTIRIGKGGTLLIDNTLALLPYHPDPADPESRQVYMELNPGATLAFGPHARIMRKFNPEEDMRLNIYMNGGTLDLGNLPAEDRALINRIYPAPATNIADNILLSPNPASDVLQCRYLAEGHSELRLEVLNSQGQVLRQQVVETGKGYNFFEIPVADLPKGWYALRVFDARKGTISIPWLKI
jgi:hypothetical protein